MQGILSKQNIDKNLIEEVELSEVREEMGKDALLLGACPLVTVLPEKCYNLPEKGMLLFFYNLPEKGMLLFFYNLPEKGTL